MSNILIINAHHKYPFSEGRLNGALVQMADERLQAKGHQTRIINIDEESPQKVNISNLISKMATSPQE